MCLPHVQVDHSSSNGADLDAKVGVTLGATEEQNIVESQRIAGELRPAKKALKEVGRTSQPAPKKWVRSCSELLP